MNYKNLNEVINYIEAHLDTKIDCKKMSKIIGLSEYSLQRIFMFLANMSLTEYIRKRRLSKALEDLKNSNMKIIDIAFKYNYNSSISFSRAFKQYFGVTPNECRKNNKKYKIFPVIKFNEDNNIYDEVSYEIKSIDEVNIYCYEVAALRHDDLLYKIRDLYKKYDVELPKTNRYGIYLNDNNKHRYLLGTTERFNNTKKIIIKKGKYAVFDVLTRNQEDIIKMYHLIYNEWLSSTNHKLRDDMFEFEYYCEDNCYVYIPIR